MVARAATPKLLQPQALRWSWALVIACGLLFGYYVLRTYASPQQRQYQLDFGKAQWIEPAESYAPVAYFRKEFYLSALPEQAWLEIAASDNFALIVNGHTLGNLDSVKTFVTGIYDIKKALKQGTNVIAVSQDDTFISLAIEEKQTLGGTHKVLLMFSVKDMQLKQWTITDPQGYDTTVALYNLDPTQKIDPTMFRINYERKEIIQ